MWIMRLVVEGMMRKVLILKTGYIETLTNERYEEESVSLGDVLRTTAILHPFKKDHVTWVTDRSAVPILKLNPRINRLLHWNLATVLQLMQEQFDILINLEKVPGICALAANIQAWQKYGFRFDAVTGEGKAYKEAINALYVAQDERLKVKSGKHWLELLYEMAGLLWKNEGYILRLPERLYDRHVMVGLNWHVGSKFPGKGWSDGCWMKLRELLANEGMTVDMQVNPGEIRLPEPGSDKLTDYMNWIDECSCLVTCDSLGLHVAMALDKRVVGLFGPTKASEMPPYSKGIMIQESKMEDITPERVCQAVKEAFSWGMG